MLHFISFSSGTCKGGYFLVDLSELPDYVFSFRILLPESRSGINSNEFCRMTTLSLLNSAPSCNRFSFTNTDALCITPYARYIFVFFSGVA